jgi:hypothetical protein
MSFDGNRTERRDFTAPHDSLRRYLLSHGWQATSHGSGEPSLITTPYEALFLRDRMPDRRSVEIFTLKEEGFENIELVVPRDSFTSDFDRRVEGIFDTLAQVEGREPDAIIADVRLIGFDVIRSRIPDELVYQDTIHLLQRRAISRESRA